MTQAKRDKLAFIHWLQDHMLTYTDLTRNDNRSQGAHDGRNLDFLLTLPSGRACLIELEGRQCVGGRIQPSLAWIKADELTALLEWERKHPRQRLNVVVWAFRTDEPPKFDPDIVLHGQSYRFTGIRASEYRRICEQRSGSWATLKLPKECFASSLLSLEDLFEVARTTSRIEVVQAKQPVEANRGLP